MHLILIKFFNCLTVFLKQVRQSDERLSLGVFQVVLLARPTVSVCSSYAAVNVIFNVIFTLFRMKHY